MIPEGDLGDLPNQTRPPSSTPARAQQRHETTTSQTASRKIEAPVKILETDVHVVCDRFTKTNQQQTRLSLTSNERHVIHSSPLFRSPSRLHSAKVGTAPRCGLAIGMPKQGCPFVRAPERGPVERSDALTDSD
jgi:hypothetical protein